MALVEQLGDEGWLVIGAVQVTAINGNGICHYAFIDEPVTEGRTKEKRKKNALRNLTKLLKFNDRTKNCFKK